MTSCGTEQTNRANRKHKMLYEKEEMMIPKLEPIMTNKTLGDRFNVTRLKSICVISHKKHYRSRLYRTRVTGRHTCIFNFTVSEMKITEPYAFSVFIDVKLCTKILCGSSGKIFQSIVMFLYEEDCVIMSMYSAWR